MNMHRFFICIVLVVFWAGAAGAQQDAAQNTVNETEGYAIEQDESFGAMDKDMSGAVSWDEYSVTFEELPQEQLRAEFDAMDEDQSGDLTRDEFTGMSGVERGYDPEADQPDESSLYGVRGMEEYDFSQMDRDNSGTVSRSEFDNYYSDVPADQRDERFETMDVNRDDKLDVGEWGGIEQQ